MKKIISYALAAAAVALALVSCNKEKLTGANQENEQLKGQRTLTVSFAGATKTTLSDDGITPVWAEGDEILLADGTATETYTVTAEQDEQSSITITTNLQNAVTAVYPADAAIEEESTIIGIAVKDVQDGTFAAANICMAEEETDGMIAFKNQTAVFKVEVPAHTTELVVTSLGEIDGASGQRGATVRPINTEGEGDAAQVITVQVADSDEFTTYYVAVLVDETETVLLANLNFDAVASTDNGAQGGFSPNYLENTKKITDPYSLKVAKNTIYNVDPTFLHEYVNVEMTVNAETKTYKWATMNVGATAENINGDYFAWGATELAYENLSDDTFTFKATKPASYSYSGWDAEKGFDDCNTPYYDGDAYTNEKYSVYKEKYVLDLCDDAANANWGGSWRMPRKEEFIALLGGSIGTFTYNFPAAGYGGYDSLESLGSEGYYWSSSLFTGSAGGRIPADETPAAWRLWFSEGEFSLSNDTRCCGFSIRALSE